MQELPKNANMTKSYKPIAIPIPDNATNGDMIKALKLNDVVFDESFDEEYVIAICKKNKYRLFISKELWNAPYKRGEVE